MGALLAARGFRPGVVFTSAATRARRTVELVLEAVGGEARIEVDWRLNERHFGQLQGLDRQEARSRFGKELVRSCAREPVAVPPELPRSDRRHPVHDVRYRHVDPARLPGGESLEQLEARVLECFHELVAPCLVRGANVLVVGHCHALRALVPHLGRSSSDRPHFSATGSGLAWTGGIGPVELEAPPHAMRP